MERKGGIKSFTAVANIFTLTAICTRNDTGRQQHSLVQRLYTAQDPGSIGAIPTNSHVMFKAHLH